MQVDYGIDRKSISPWAVYKKARLIFTASWLLFFRFNFRFGQWRYDGGGCQKDSNILNQDLVRIQGYYRFLNSVLYLFRPTFRMSLV